MQSPKEEIDKLLDIEFIYEIEHTGWVSAIVVVPKKNGKFRVFVNLKKVNAATVPDHYPLPIMSQAKKLIVFWMVSLAIT